MTTLLERSPGKVTEPARKIKCTVADGRFVEPCDTFARMVDHNSSGKVKGIVEWSLVNMTTFDPSRRYYGARTHSFAKGIAFNFCPMCGTQIDAPFAEPLP